MTTKLEAVLRNAAKLVEWREGLTCPTCGKVATYATAKACEVESDCPVAFARRKASRTHA